MTDVAFVDFCKETIRDYVNKHIDKSDRAEISTDDVFIVWQVKALQNWKALASTTLFDGMYYEITYNGDKGEAYIDCYKKWENFVITPVVTKV
jgi:hypothetical protein